MNLKIAQMASTPNHELILAKFHFSDTFSASLKGMNDGIAFEIKVTGATIEEAAEALYSKWLHLTDRVPELRAALPAPFDEIPF